MRGNIPATTFRSIGVAPPSPVQISHSRAIPAATRQTSVNIFQPRWKKKPVVTTAAAAAEPVVADDGVNTSLWGPGLWRALHTASLIASAATMAAIATALTNSLPCPECRGHYQAWLAGHPVEGVSDMVSWFLDLHNDVNRRNGAAVWTRDAVQNTYVDVTGASSALAGISGYLSGEVVGMLSGIFAV
jgi:Erv1 / Alr family